MKRGAGIIDDVYLASLYRIQAAIFLDSARKLSATLELKSDGTPAKLSAIPFYFLISHAAELFLKAALLKRAFDQGNLKKYDYRHNLSSLLKELQELGV